jgi:hypothetical protein
MSTATPESACRCCGEAKAPRMYLCRGCWFTLQPTTRTALNRRDAFAMRRLSDLYEALRQGTALHLIEVGR